VCQAQQQKEKSNSSIMNKFLIAIESREGQRGGWCNVITDDSLPLEEGKPYINKPTSMQDWYLNNWQEKFLIDYPYRPRIRVIAII